MAPGCVPAALFDGDFLEDTLRGGSGARPAAGSHCFRPARRVCDRYFLSPAVVADRTMKDLTQGSVVTHLVQMASFLAVSMVVQTLYLLADLYWVGHLGKEAIAAVGVAGNLTMIVLALTQMLGVGTTTLISQATGRKDQVHAELVFNQSGILSLVIAVFLGIVGFSVRGVYSDSLSADAETASLARSY